MEALATFQSVKRRLEVRAEVDGVTIIDDFAHHPTAIRETLRALRTAYPGRRLWAVLEPRSNTLRRNVFEEALVESLALADRSVLAAVFKSEAIPAAERLHPENVADGAAGAGTSSRRCMRMRMRLSRRLRRSCEVGMWWRLCRMVGLAGSMRSCRRRWRRLRRKGQRQLRRF